MLFIFAESAESQVNIERRRWRGVEEGAVANLDFGFAMKRGNSDVTDLFSSGTVGYNADPHRAFLVGNIEYGSTAEEKFLNRSMAHLRYNLLLSGSFAAELFGQVEYDEFRLLKNRWLLGGGGRWKLKEAKLLGVVVGLSAFFEHETIDLPAGDPGCEQDLIRMSSYLVLNLTINDRAGFNFVGYVQPRTDDWADIRSIVDASLQFAVSRRVEFGITYNLRYDNQPPESVKRLDVTLRNTFRINL